MTAKRAVGLVVLLVVTACGGSAGTTAPVTTASTATQAPATTASTSTQAPAAPAATASTATQAPAATAAMTTATGSEYLGSYTRVDEEFGTMMTVTVDGSIRTINSNALPDHETGDFPNSGNPNTISEQDVSYDFATEPIYTGAATGVRMTGVAVNGVKFEPGTAENVTCGTGETFRVEALQDIYNLGFDFNNAHVQPTGEYHYHGVSQLLVEAYEHDGDLVHVGFAADGFLMYYSKSGAYGSGYELVMADRTGTDCVLSLRPGTRSISMEQVLTAPTPLTGSTTRGAVRLIAATASRSVASTCTSSPMTTRTWVAASTARYVLVPPGRMAAQKQVVLVPARRPAAGVMAGPVMGPVAHPT